VDYPRPGWAEQSATDIWHSVQRVIAEVANAAGPHFDSLAISNQRETIVAWDAASGMPLAPAITWQCRRSVARCEAIRAAGHADLIEQRTGLGLDPLFPAAKIGWLIDNVRAVRDAADRNTLRVGTVDSWLLWNLTDGQVHATDHSNASRTQLLDTEAFAWDDELLGIFGVPAAPYPISGAPTPTLPTSQTGQSGLLLERRFMPCWAIPTPPSSVTASARPVPSRPPSARARR
jgi:glycerol kinase